jgi:hypothetical protein
MRWLAYAAFGHHLLHVLPAVDRNIGTSDKRRFV